MTELVVSAIQPRGILNVSTGGQGVGKVCAYMTHKAVVPVETLRNNHRTNATTTASATPSRARVAEVEYSSVFLTHRSRYTIGVRHMTVYEVCHHLVEYSCRELGTMCGSLVVVHQSYSSTSTCSDRCSPTEQENNSNGTD